ncbi:putative peptidyl-tRNA hydrolase PTRHD1, partial [Bienertia sinuspersici]
TKKTNIDAITTDAETKTVKLNSSEEELVVQYVVVRRDLIDKCPLGNDPATLSYCSPSSLDSMHKVTLEVEGEIQIVNLLEKLKSNGILHKLWIEQPENIPTCLATKAYPKSMVSPFFRKLKLCK